MKELVSDLLDRLNSLASMPNEMTGSAAQRGYQFEEIILDAFSRCGCETKTRSRIEDIEIDGYICFNGNWHPLEAKWTASPIGSNEIFKFDAKLRALGRYQAAFFFSYSGYKFTAVQAISKLNNSRIILWDGKDIKRVLEGAIMLSYLTDKKISALEVRSCPYLRVEEVIRSITPIKLKESKDILGKGRFIFPGIVAGKFTTMRNISEKGESPENKILVHAFSSDEINANNLYNVMQPIEEQILKAIGAVVNIGGGLDHFSARLSEQIARSGKKIPVLGGCMDLKIAKNGLPSFMKKIIHHGQRIIVDASAGKVYLYAGQQKRK